MRATSCVLIVTIALTGVLACTQQVSPIVANADGRQNFISNCVRLKVPSGRGAPAGKRVLAVYAKGRVRSS
jgi:hypothetical protein